MCWIKTLLAVRPSYTTPDPNNLTSLPHTLSAAAFCALPFHLVPHREQKMILSVENFRGALWCICKALYSIVTILPDWEGDASAHRWGNAAAHGLQCLWSVSLWWRSVWIAPLKCLEPWPWATKVQLFHTDLEKIKFQMYTFSSGAPPHSGGGIAGYRVLHFE